MRATVAQAKATSLREWMGRRSFKAGWAPLRGRPPFIHLRRRRVLGERRRLPDLPLAILLGLRLSGGLTAAPERDEVIGELRRVARRHRATRVAHVAPGPALEAGPARGLVGVLVGRHPLIHVPRQIVDAEAAHAPGLLPARHALVERQELLVLHALVARVHQIQVRADIGIVDVALLRIPAAAVRERQLLGPSQAATHSLSRQRRFPSASQAASPSCQLTITGG